MQKKLRSFLILKIMLFVLIYGCGQAEKAAKKKTEAKSIQVGLDKAHMAERLIVYYFHTEYRCWSCNQFEKLTNEVLEESFRDQVAKGKVEYRPVNVEADHNKHYIEDYKLITKSIILSLQKENKQVEWKNMDKIWTLVRDAEKFKIYLKEGIADYVKKVNQS